MKIARIILIPLFSIFAGPIIAQVHKALDKGFIEKTIEYYYSTQAKIQKNNPVFFIEKDNLTMDAKTDYGIFKIKFLSAKEASQKLPGVKNEDARLDRLLVKWVSLDTIDVLITGCTIGVRKVNQTVNHKTTTSNENFLTNCTESFVSMPTCRFVYDGSSMTWTQLNRGKSTR